MFRFLLFLAIVGITSFVVAAVIGWIARTFPRSRVFIAFLLTCAATYSLAFCFDMVVLAFTGGLPVANAIMPIFVWFGIGGFLQALAFFTSPVRWPLLVPHTINAVLAASVGFVHSGNFVIGALVLLVGVLVFFAKPKRKPTFPVGGYTLNMAMPDGPPLREFSQAEYQALGAIEFVGGKIYDAPAVDFVAARWRLNLGAVYGKLYKIALFLELSDKREASQAAFAAMTFCNERLGKPTQQQTGLFIWDTTDGNVVLQTAEALDGFAVNLFFTASSVRDFQRI